MGILIVLGVVALMLFFAKNEGERIESVIENKPDPVADRNSWLGYIGLLIVAAFLFLTVASIGELDAVMDRAHQRTEAVMGQR